MVAGDERVQGAQEHAQEKPWLRFYDAGVPATLSYSDLPLHHVLTRSASAFPNHIATRFVLRYLAGGRWVVGGTLSYHRLNELVDRFATALAQLGVSKGDRVALMLPNSPQFLIAFFAVLRLGAVVVTINPTYTGRELHYHLNDSGAETMILLNLFWERLRPIYPDTPLKRVIVTTVSDILSRPNRLLVHVQQWRNREQVAVPPEHHVFFFEHLLKNYGPYPPHVEIGADDVALLQYTGGTTGIPRAAMLTHRNIMANTTQIKAWLADGQPGDERMMAAIPFFHAYGLSVCLLLGVALGAELVMVPDPRQIEHVMETIQRERCTLFPGVPAMYIGIINHPYARRYDMRSIRACISGAASLPMDIQQRFDALTGGRLVEGFGLTEASPVTHCTPLYGERRAGSMGVPFPDVEVRLIDLETGVDLPFDGTHTGELLVRGPQVMQQGYWQRPDETQDVLDADGWLHTGDICRADRDGYFYVVDRKKDVIVVSGFKVLPREVEEVLYMHPAVREAVVVGVPHPERGDDTVKAFLVPRTAGHLPSVEDIRAFCRLYLAPYKVPREIMFRSDLPRTVVGKVMRRMLVDEELAQQQ